MGLHTTVCTLEENHVTMQAQLFHYDSNNLLLRLSFQQLRRTGIFLPLEVADDGELVLERPRALQPLYPQIAVHTAFLMLCGV
jgi:hypothetical protein